MNVNKLMKQKAVTKYRLSQNSGVPYTTVCDICNGKTKLKNCSVKTVYKIAEALGVSMESSPAAIHRKEKRRRRQSLSFCGLILWRAKCVMSSEGTGVFTKENLDTMLKELAKEFKKRNGTTAPAEIILIGGAAVLTGYGFREMTTDVDAVIHASSAMKEAAGKVGDKYNLPHEWLNSDFMRTDSYSPKLE